MYNRPRSGYRPSLTTLDWFRVYLDTREGSTLVDASVVRFRDVYAAARSPSGIISARTATLHYRSDGAWRIDGVMHESEQPFATNCPERILDLLSPTEEEGALRWRGLCRTAIARRRAAREIPSGTWLCFQSGFNLGRNWGVQREFQLVRSGKRTLLFHPGSQDHYRPSDWHKRSFEILPGPSTLTSPPQEYEPTPP